MVSVGEKAPDFTLEDGGKNKVSLSQLKGKSVLLAFFPFAFSPVCTNEMTCFEDDLSELKDLGVHVLGISIDSSWSQKAFARSLNLTFPLLSDFSKEVCKKYGTLRLEGFSNRAYFLIDDTGTVKFKHIMQSPGEKLENAELFQKIRDVV